MSECGAKGCDLEIRRQRESRRRDTLEYAYIQCFCEGTDKIECANLTDILPYIWKQVSILSRPIVNSLPCNKFGFQYAPISNVVSLATSEAFAINRRAACGSCATSLKLRGIVEIAVTSGHSGTRK